MECDWYQPTNYAIVSDPELTKSPSALQHYQVEHYTPETDQILFKSGTMIQRIMFYQQPSNWDDLEAQHLEGFTKYIQQLQNNLVPQDFPEQEIIRNLHGAAWVYKDAYRDIIAQIEWRKKSLPLSIQTEEAKVIKSGFITIYGRDKWQRPILLLRPQVQVPGVSLTAELLVRVAGFVMFYMRQHMFKKGKVEAQVMLVDLEFALPWSIPLKALTGVGDVMSMQFRCQAARVFILNATSPIVWTYKQASKVLQEIQRRKVVIVDSHTCPELDAMIAPEMRVKAYGGTQETPECWWPPIIPNQDLVTHSEIVDSVRIDNMQNYTKQITGGIQKLNTLTVNQSQAFLSEDHFKEYLEIEQVDLDLMVVHSQSCVDYVKKDSLVPDVILKLSKSLPVVDESSPIKGRPKLKTDKKACCSVQ